MARNEVDVWAVLPMIPYSRLVSLIGIEEVPIGIIRCVEQMSVEALPIFEKLKCLGDCLPCLPLQRPNAVSRQSG